MQKIGMKCLALIILTLIDYNIGLIETKMNWLTDDFIEYINQQNQGRWTADKNFFVNYSEEQLKALADVRGYHSHTEFKPYTRKNEKVLPENIPENFDARLKWPQCSSIGTIRNQGLCGGSWAFAATEVMSDRICIYSNGMVDFNFSAEELISCCVACGNGCDGGYVYPPFEYWKYIGIPSGGDMYKEEMTLVYNSAINELDKLTKGDLIDIVFTKEVPNHINLSKITKDVVENGGHKFVDRYQGCKPFTALSGSTPGCQRECRPDYNKTWEEDVRHGLTAYHVEANGLQIQAEIMEFGPVAATFDMYNDFFSYKEGVYDHISWELLGHHAVKIIGWGVENGLPYWLLAGSWGPNFGLEGCVKILRGVNHCGIEYEVTAGVPNCYE